MRPAIEFSIDNGVTFTNVLPTYPTPFIARCIEEVCGDVNLNGLDPSMDAVDASICM